MPQPRTAQGTSPSLTAQVLDRLRRDILSCALPPEARLRLEDLRERYGTGLSPIRETLMRLEAEGLVVLEPNRGFRVAPISRAHLSDLTANRIELEAIALRWAIARGGVDWEAEILAAFHRLRRQSKADLETGGMREEWKKEHRAFHRALVAGCASPILISLHDSLFDQAERYVAVSITRKAIPRDDVGEHQRLMEAVVARKPELALRASRDHIQRTTDKVLDKLRALAA